MVSSLRMCEQRYVLVSQTRLRLGGKQASMDGGFDFVLSPMVHPDRRPPPLPAKKGDPITPMFTPEQAITLPSLVRENV
jgi:hypothetical protein